MSTFYYITIIITSVVRLARLTGVK